MSGGWQRSTFCDTGNCLEVKWVKACESAACVEAASVDGAILVRDSKDKNGPVLNFTPAEWTAFLEGVHRGEFDHLVG